MLVEDFDEEDVIEFVESKGTLLEAYRKQYLELQKSIEMLTASNTGKEREVDILHQEYKGIRDQLLLAKRNVDEIISQQEVLKEKTDAINIAKEGYIERESSFKMEMLSYTDLFTELKDLLSVGSDWTPEQVEQRIVLEKQRDFLSSKYEGKLSSLNQLRNENHDLYEKIQKIEKENIKLDEEIVEVDNARYETKKNVEKLGLEKEELDKKIYEVRTKIIDGESDIAERLKNNNNEDKSLKELDVSIARSKLKMDQFISEYDQLFKKLQELTGELERQLNQNKKIEDELEEKKKEIQLKHIEVKRVKKEMTKLGQLKDIAKQKCAVIDEERQVIDQNIDELNRKIQQLRDVEIIAAKREVESVEKQISELRQQLDVVRKKHLGSDKSSKAIADLIQLNKNGKINLNVEIKVLKEEVQYQKNKIRELLIEKDKFEKDAESANQQYYTALEELKLQELQVQELNDKITSDQNKLKSKQTLYETIRSDRNLYSKQLIDSQEEINGLKRTFRDMNHSIDHMKEEIAGKDHEIIKEHFAHHSVDKERELLRNEITKIKKQLNSSETIIENQRIEVLKLLRIIDEAEIERSRQRNELAAVLSERTLLTGQLVKRNSELNEMYDRIKLQRSNLRIGERNYNDITEQLAKWQNELIGLVESNNDTVQGLVKLDEYRFRIVQLEKEITKEKTRTRALDDELDVTMNVHRWRTMESSDPKRYEKIGQVQLLQKQLIAFSDKITQNELLIQEKEKIYMELKNVIGRQPGPEVEEQILVYQQTLKDKAKQLSSMDLELEMYIEQVSRFKEEISSMDTKMSQLIKKWIKIRRKK